MIQDTALVIVSGGSGTRYGAGNKLFSLLGGIPVLIHSVRNLGPLFPPECRIMAVPEAEKTRFKEVIDRFAPDCPFRLVSGGATRSGSVRNALAAIPEGIRYAAIHDAARPLATCELLQSVLEAARETGGAVPGHAVADTLKRADGACRVIETVDREQLFAVETPQCFDLSLLREAYRRDPDSRTDDAGTMEKAGFAVRIVRHNDCNAKLTYPGDLTLLEAMFSERRSPRPEVLEKTRV